MVVKNRAQDSPMRKNERAKRKERRRQIALIKLERGCKHCGYNRNPAALHFHHRNPDEKEFELGMSHMTRNWDKVIIEMAKCDVVCANCHAELTWEW